MKRFCFLFLQILVVTFSQAQNSCFTQPAEVDFIVGSGPTRLHIVDLNNDGLSDIMTTNNYTNNIVVQLANSNGSYFSAPITIPIINIPSLSETADFNNDGNIDFVTINWNSSLVRLYAGNGAGGFSPMATYTINLFSNATSLGVSDFNYDGNKDILVGTNSTNGALLLTGNGAGSFSPSYVYPNMSVGYIVEDVTSDGKPDLLHLPLSAPFDNLLVLPANSTGFGFGAAISSTINTFLNSFSPAGFGIGDINNDGNKDVVVVSASTFSNENFAAIMLGNGAGTFTVNQMLKFPFNNLPSRVLIGDVNNDNNNDIILSSSSNYHLFLNQGAGQFKDGTKFAGFQSISDVRILDLNGDQRKDILLSEMGNNNVHVDFSLPYGKVGDVWPTDFVVDDIDNDNVNEIIMATNSNSVTILKNTLQGFYTPVTNYSVGYTPRGITYVDVNNDGRKDIITANNFAASNISILLSTATGSFGAASNITLNGDPWSAEPTDFNNNGNIDLVAAMPNSNQIRFLSGNGNGGFTNIGFLNTTYSLPFRTRFADLNNDGNQDMLVAYYSTSNFTRHLGTGFGTFNSASTLAIGALDAALKDVNGDGQVDIVTMSPTGLAVLLGTGTGTFLPAVSYPMQTSSMFISIELKDLNLDGTLDAIVGFQDGYSTALNNGNGVFGSIQNFNMGSFGGGAIRAARMDGDNFPDLVSEKINIFPNLTSSITAASSLSFCSGSSVVLNGPISATSYTWMPGGANTASLLVNSGGTYSLISGNGNCTSTSSQLSVNVLPAPPISGNSPSVCAGSSTVLVLTGASSYTWSGGGNTNTLLVTPTVSTIYTVSGTGANNCSGTQTLAVTVSTACADVWPGDANSDGIANNLDVLELGLRFNQSGPARSSVANLWQAYTANSWTGTISNGKNQAHADCDGSGLVDLNDTLGIFLNFNQTHAFRPVPSSQIQLDIVSNQASVLKGKWGSANIILGNALSPVTANGIAFTLNYNNSLIETDSIYILYPTSFLNANGQNLNFRKRNFGNGVIYTATTHTVSSDVTGDGVIASVHFKLKSSLSTNTVLTLGLNMGYSSNQNGVLTPLTTGQTTIAAVTQLLGVTESLLNEKVQLFPNPSKGTVTIESVNPIYQIDIYSVTGQLLETKRLSSSTSTLEISNLTVGIYFIQIKTLSGYCMRKLVVEN